MADKDLGESLENMEESIENLKNKEFRVFGIKVTFMSVSALSGSARFCYRYIILWIHNVSKIEEVANLDIGAFEQRMEVMETQLSETVDYTRDIKNGLRDDILMIERNVDRVEDKLRQQEQENREIIQNAEERFENKRDALQNDYDEKANRLAERNDSRMIDLEEKVERDLKDLEDRLNKRLQRALDNPLAN